MKETLFIDDVALLAERYQALTRLSQHEDARKDDLVLILNSINQDLEACLEKWAR